MTRRDACLKGAVEVCPDSSRSIGKASRFETTSAICRRNHARQKLSCVRVEATVDIPCPVVQPQSLLRQPATQLASHIAFWKLIGLVQVTFKLAISAPDVAAAIMRDNLSGSVGGLRCHATGLNGCLLYRPSPTSQTKGLSCLWGHHPLDPSLRC